MAHDIEDQDGKVTAMVQRTRAGYWVFRYVSCLFFYAARFFILTILHLYGNP